MDSPNIKHNILCIDDDTALHVLLESQLAISGYQSIHATTGAEAFIALKKYQFDLIILDISMPIMDGFQILDCLKMDSTTRDIPVIFLSSLNRENLKVKGLESGAEDFIVKPFTGPELIARIKVILRRNAHTRKNSAGVQGNLVELGLFELLHMFSFSRKCAVVTFPEMEGELIVAHGFVLSVSQGIWSDKEALLRLFYLERGSFKIQYTEEKGNKIGSIERLLLLVSNALDEIKEQINEIAPKGAKVQLMTNPHDCPEFEMLKSSSPISLDELILTMRDKLRANLYYVREAVQKKQIAVKSED